MNLIHKISAVSKELLASLDHVRSGRGTSISLLPDIVDFCGSLMDSGAKCKFTFCCPAVDVHKNIPICGESITFKVKNLHVGLLYTLATKCLSLQNNGSQITIEILHREKYPLKKIEREGVGEGRKG